MCSSDLLAYRFAPGVVQGLPGARLTVTYSLAPGVAAPAQVPGASLAIAYSFTAGVAAPGPLSGASLTIAYSLTAGVAQALPGAGDSAAYWSDWRALDNDLFLYE